MSGDDVVEILLRQCMPNLNMRGCYCLDSSLNYEPEHRQMSNVLCIWSFSFSRLILYWARSMNSYKEQIYGQPIYCYYMFYSGTSEEEMCFYLFIHQLVILSYSHYHNDSCQDEQTYWISSKPYDQSRTYLFYVQSPAA